MSHNFRLYLNCFIYAIQNHIMFRTTAVALGGETLHHFAGCGVPSLVSDFGRCWKQIPMSNWQSVEVLIIDEISMLAGEFLDNLSDVVKQIRHHDNRAFGGIQLK